ncbi:MAG: iron-containing alcohol dehydrogenase [Bdellovibrionales bacterium]
MNSFQFYNPVKIYFGENQIKEFAPELEKAQRVLLVYGGGSIKKNGVYDACMQACHGKTVFEYSGIEPNPEYETLMKAVRLARTEKVDYIIAAGGGSVIDGTKFISAAIPFEGEPWDIPTKNPDIKNVIPFGCIQTLPATGSEMNCFSVVSRSEQGLKVGFGNPMLYPKFSVLDPLTTKTLPDHYVANGVVDSFVHVLEQYLTYPVNAPLQDRFCESILSTLVEEGPKTLKNKDDSDSRANFMWSSTMALNGLIGAGVPHDWSTHMIGHELTALFGIDHARTLAVVLPEVLKFQLEDKRAKLTQYGERVWGLSGDNIAEDAVLKTSQFFEEMGIPTKLSKYDIDAEKIKTVATALKQKGMTQLGENQKITPDVAVDLLSKSLNS